MWISFTKIISILPDNYLFNIRSNRKTILSVQAIYYDTIVLNIILYNICIRKHIIIVFMDNISFYMMLYSTLDDTQEYHHYQS
jgi:hypothetical protein